MYQNVPRHIREQGKPLYEEKDIIGIREIKGIFVNTFPLTFVVFPLFFFHFPFKLKLLSTGDDFPL